MYITINGIRDLFFTGPVFRKSAKKLTGMIQRSLTSFRGKQRQTEILGKRDERSEIQEVELSGN